MEIRAFVPERRTCLGPDGSRSLVSLRLTLITRHFRPNHDQIQAERFNEACSRFQAGEKAEALTQIRELAQEINDPLDISVVLYYETLFLLEMNELHEARQRLEQFQSLLAPLGPPPDNYEDDLATNLAVMVRYAKLRVLFAEGRDSEALQTLEDLISRYPKQLSTRRFHETSEVINACHGTLLANAGRWKEAKPFLERAHAPESWSNVLAFYRGQCYAEFRDYARARGELTEALKLGLSGYWEPRAHYNLGIVYFHLGAMAAAKNEFELCLQMADPAYLAETKIWEWLEATCRKLGESDQAEKYRRLRGKSWPSSRN
jgi:tetratricopeptide (TPR) repeat protein